MVVRPFHTHPCARCHAPAICEGEQERNHDGFPDVICVNYHLETGVVARLLCDACQDAQPAEAKA